MNQIISKNVFIENSFEKTTYMSKQLFHEALFNVILEKNQNTKSAILLREDRHELLQEFKLMGMLDGPPSAPPFLEGNHPNLLQEFKLMGMIVGPPSAPPCLQNHNFPYQDHQKWRWWIDW